jgi:hypothetical protein
MTEKRKSTLFLLFAIIFVGLAISGGIRGYSPVPFWDMWDGYLNFYVKITSGDWSAWWAQHNEHRIVLARILFFIDIFIFEGRGWFLIIFNYFLLSIVCLLFWNISKEISEKKHNWIGYFLVGWLFFWSQKENLEWGFQSQFFLAQLLPLAALYFLHLTVRAGSAKNNYFLFALVLGCCSIGTIAKGVLALPIMAGYALVTRMGWKRVVLLGLFSVSAVLIYFHGYTTPTDTGSIGQAIRSNPIELIHYVILYIGGPFSYGSLRLGLWIAGIAGSFFIISSLFFALRISAKAKGATLHLALLAFILYFGGTALGTAGGRLIFGVNQALSSRYSTPSLMAWAALLLLYTPVINTLRQSFQDRLWIVFAILLTSMLPKQMTALASEQARLYERNVAALAIEMGVIDQTQISSVFPKADWALSLARVPVERNLSIFGLPPLYDLRKSLGQPYKTKKYPVRECPGHLDEIQPVPEDSRFLRVQGWMFDPSAPRQPQIIKIIDIEGKTVGFAYSGGARPDVGLAVGEKASYSGFKGYVFSGKQGDSVSLINEDMQCQLVRNIPVSLFNVRDANVRSLSISVMSASIMDDNEWLGKDYEKSNFPGIAVLGSFINSDSDIGSVSLRIKRGDRLLYRSGPTAGRQVIEILNSNLPSAILPVATEWKILDFSSELLPDKFTARFSDNGTNWGEWSAIGVATR